MKEKLNKLSIPKKPKTNAQNTNKQNNFFSYLQEKSRKTGHKLIQLYQSIPNENIKDCYANLPKDKAPPKMKKPSKQSKKEEKYLCLDVENFEGQLNENYQCFKEIWRSQEDYGKVLQNRLQRQKVLLHINICETENQMNLISELKGYIMSIINLSTKIAIAICIKKDEKYYDLLSIKKEPKSDTKSLVKTYITNNNKSKSILMKLLKFACEGQTVIEGENKRIIFHIEVNIGGVAEKKENQSSNVPTLQMSKKKLVEIHAQKKQIFNLMNFDSKVGGICVVKMIKDHEECLNALFPKKQNVKQEQVKDPLVQEEEKLRKIITQLESQLQTNKKQLDLYIQKAMDLESEELAVASERASIGLLSYLNSKTNLLGSMNRG